MISLFNLTGTNSQLQEKNCNLRKQIGNKRILVKICKDYIENVPYNLINIKFHSVTGCTQQKFSKYLK